MQRRRELAGVSERSPLPKIILLVVVLAVLGYVGYLGWLAHAAGQRFAAAKASEDHPLTLTGMTEFLPNTLLAAMDPAFYSPNTLKGSALTRRLVHVYYPDASAMSLRVMAVSIESRYSKTEIMESFINQASMGGTAHPAKGLAAASTQFFGKPFAQLAPQDIALLVALMQDPTLDPFAAADKATTARNAALQADLQQNVLSQAQVDNLSKMPLDLAAPAPAAPAATPPVTH
ncbi:MAG TPA: transglycosylase domain-containing protein [Gammaproteobacteria bacterium]|jgi:hypothetical protein